MIRRLLHRAAKAVVRATETSACDPVRMGMRISVHDEPATAWERAIAPRELEQIAEGVKDAFTARPLDDFVCGAACEAPPREVGEWHGTPAAEVVQADADLHREPLPEIRSNPMPIPRADRKPPEHAGTAAADVKPADLAGAIAARTEPGWSSPAGWDKTAPGSPGARQIIEEVREKLGPGRGRKFCGVCGVVVGACVKKCIECGYIFPRSGATKPKGITVGPSAAELDA